MPIDWNIVYYIVVPIAVAVISVASTRWWERRPRLIAYLAHASGVRITPGDGGQPFYINLHTVVLRNDGSRAATNVRLGHQPLQYNYHVQPVHDYTTNTLPGGGNEIVFPTFPPKRQVTITYLYSGATWEQINTHFESDEGRVKIHNVLPTRQFSRAFNRAAFVVFSVGLVTVVYLVWLAVRTAWNAWMV